MPSIYPFLPNLLQQFKHADSTKRFLVGIVGAPGSGKSYQAERLPEIVNAELGEEVATFLAMDGYHYFNEYLYSQGMHAHKGSHFTFDVQAFMEKLIELKENPGPVNCPIYDRSLHDPTPNGHLIQPKHKIVFIEGNYLLLRVFPWIGIRYILDYCVFVDVDPKLQFERLLERHITTGKSPKDAEAKVHRTDLTNSELILQDKDRADVVFRPEGNF